MSGKVLVVDDDAIAGGLSRDLLQDAGYEVELITDTRRVMDEIKAKRPQIVIMDILMPGIDGLTLCHTIKRDLALKSTKVVMVSGKSFATERQRAKQYGADLFIQKPYNVDTFVSQIGEIMARSAAPSILTPASAFLPEISSNPDPVMTATIWGCRSEGGPEASEPSRYGRRTSCVSLELGEHLLVFDAGSGIAPFGDELVKSGRYKEIWLFMTHFHRDHAEGLGAFVPARLAGYKLHISGAREPDKGLQELAQEAFLSTLPNGVSLDAEIDLYEILEEAYGILPGTTLTAFYANHPGNTLGFTVEARGRKFAYCPDTELYGETATAFQDYDEKSGKLCAGADLLIHNGRYTAEDYITMKDSGHSSAESALDFAGKNGVKRLVLFHHDNQYADERLDLIAHRAAQRIKDRGYSFQCALAREGLKIAI